MRMPFSGWVCDFAVPLLLMDVVVEVQPRPNDERRVLRKNSSIPVTIVPLTSTKYPVIVFIAIKLKVKSLFAYLV